MRFELNGNFITGLVDITDISIDGDGINNPLICESERTIISQSPLSMGNWYLHSESQSIATSDKLGDSERGWIRTRTTTAVGYRQVRLRRQSATGAREGRFTCQITNDNNPIKSLYVLYPSEL